MSAREVVAEFIRGEVGHWDDGMLVQADDLLSALSEAGYTVARLEQVGRVFMDEDEGEWQFTEAQAADLLAHVGVFHLDHARS